MKDTHKHSFEEEFRKAFEEAEATPEPAVWAEIDAHLANQEASVYKRKLYYFKIGVAAAAVVLFGFLGGWLVFSENLFSQQQIAHDNSLNATQIKKPKSATAQLSEEAAQVQEEMPVAEAEKTVTAGKKSVEEAIAGNPLPDATGTNPTSTITQGNTQTPLVELPDNSVQQRKQKLSGNKSMNGNNDLPRESDVLENSKGKKPDHSQNLITGNATNTFSGLPPKPAVDKTESGTVSSPLQKNRVASVTANTINRLNNNIRINDLPLIMEAPAIKPQINSNFMVLVEEAGEKKINAASKWAMNVAFTPNQFNPNMQVDQGAVNSPYMTYNSANRSFSSPTNLSPGIANTNASPVSNDLENAQTLGISYNIGINISYALSDRFSVQSGVQYMRNNSQIITANYLEDFDSRARYPAFLSLVSNNANSPISNNANADVKANTNPVLQNANFSEFANPNAYPGVTEVAVYNTYQYMSIPVRLHYKIIDKRFSTSVGAGIAADVFLNNTVGNKDANINVTNMDSQASIYKSIGMSGIFSTKLDYEISSRYSLFLEPSYRTALASFTKSYIVKSLPSAFGIGTGFQFRF